MFNLYDKVWYEGNQLGIPKLLYTVYGDEIEMKGVKVTPVVYQQDASSTFTRHLIKTDLLSLIRRGPKYAREQLVSIIQDGSIVTAQVTEVFTTFNDKPTTYRLKLDNESTTSYFSLPESEIYPLLADLPRQDSSTTTLKHINMVAGYIIEFSQDLLRRAMLHDKSKLQNEVEKELLDIMEYKNNTEGYVPYGSEEYNKRTAILKPMLKSHYANNSHHPEHYENGVYGMNLLDFIEMVVADWPAAAHRNGDTTVGLTMACERYGINDQLKSIIANQYSKMGIVWK